MATNFPTGLDSLTNPTPTDTLSNPSHSDQHANANDAIEALEAKVGVNGSAVTSTIDYFINNTAATKAGTETLTNKTISLANNTVTMTLAQLNTAVTDADVAGLTTAQTLTNKTIALGSNTVSGTLAQFNAAVTDADLVSLAGAETLTNKQMQLASNTISGSLSDFNNALLGADFASLAGAETLTNKTIGMTTNTISGTLAQFNTAVTDADLVSIAGTETLTNKTLTSPVVNTPTITGGTFIQAEVRSLEEKWTTTASAAPATITYDVLSQSALGYTVNNTGNFTVNFRGDASTTLTNTLLSGASISVLLAVQNGTTAYYLTDISIDGSPATVYWLNKSAVVAGTASARDIYYFVLHKQSDATIVVYASRAYYG